MEHGRMGEVEGGVASGLTVHAFRLGPGTELRSGLLR